MSKRYTTVEGAGGGGTGDVSGPASSTDNAIVRFDGTAGKTLQNSSVTVTDAGEVLSSNGAASTPTYAFLSQPALGLYRFASGRIRIRADQLDLVSITGGLDLFDLNYNGGNVNITWGGLASQSNNGLITWLAVAGVGGFWSQVNLAGTFSFQDKFGQHTATRIRTTTAGINLVQDLDSGVFEFGKPLLAGIKITANTGTVTPAIADSGTLFTNTGDTDGSIITLPNDPTIGTTFEAFANVAQGITINAATGESIQDGVTNGTSTVSSTQGAWMRLIAVTGGSGAIWGVCGKLGTWVTT